MHQMLCSPCKTKVARRTFRSNLARNLVPETVSLAASTGWGGACHYVLWGRPGLRSLGRGLGAVRGVPRRSAGPPLGDRNGCGETYEQLPRGVP